MEKNFKRTPETIELNKRLEIKRIGGLQFPHPLGAVSAKGWAFYIAGKGFVKFKFQDNFLPYTPCGGKKALQSILADGGFIEYDSLEFINPVVR